MSPAPNLLNDDGTASIATAFMMSHHAFRRDLAQFQAALAALSPGVARSQALSEEWKHFRGALHGHHEIEDTVMFPGLRAQSASIAETLDRLAADHRRIDPLLEQGDRAFAELPATAGAALAVIGEISTLLHPHLALEEAEVTPFLRGTSAFPPPPTDADAAMYAAGFAWSMQGIAPDVLSAVHAMLPESIRSQLPAARAAYEARSERAFGKSKPGSARTPIPES
jgi:hypothetical protein